MVVHLLLLQKFSMAKTIKRRSLTINGPSLGCTLLTFLPGLLIDLFVDLVHDPTGRRPMQQDGQHRFLNLKLGNKKMFGMEIFSRWNQKTLTIGGSITVQLTSCLTGLD